MRFSVGTAAWSFVFLIAACHDVPQAPKTQPPTPSPFAVLSLRPPVSDYATWMGVEVISDASGLVHVFGVDFDVQYHGFFYGGCTVACQQVTRWLTGVTDSTVNCCGSNLGVVLGPQGFVAVVEDNGIELKTCPGDCFKTSSWTTTMAFASGRLGDFGGHSHPLAIDTTGMLHMVYRLANGGTLRYGECLATCGDSASWQSTVIDSDTAANRVLDAALALDPTGGSHVAVTTLSGGVRYFTCESACSVAGSWSMTTIDSTTAREPSLAIGRDGLLHLAYEVRPAGVPRTRIATCPTACDSTTSWALTTLDIGGSDVSVALDPSLHPWLAVAGPFVSSYSGTVPGTVTLLHCTTGCGAPAAWSSQVVDSMMSGSWVSLKIDGAGGPHIATSGFGVQYAQLRDTSVVVGARK